MFDEVHYWQLVRDNDGNIKTWRLLDINPAAERSWGMKREEVIGKTAEEIFSPHARELFMPLVTKIFSDGVAHSWETYFPDLDQHLKMTSVPFGDCFISTGVDITELKNARQLAEESEESLRYVLDVSELSYWDHDIQTNHMTRSLKHDQQFGHEEMLSEWSYEIFLNQVMEEDRQRVDSAYKNAVATRGEYDVEFRCQWPDKSIHWLWCKGRFITDTDGNVIRAAGIQADITIKKHAEEEIHRLAYKDGLTNLPNKTAFYDRLEQTISQTARRNDYAALLFLDIDDFKKINDTLGHDVGDKLLIHIADALRQNLREVDTLARFGGDEFLIIASDIGNTVVQARANLDQINNKIQHLFKQEINVDGHPLYVTSSIGARVFSGKDESISDIIKQADLAMYKAKESGKNAMRFFDASMGTVLAERIEIENDLRRALEEDQFYLVYQPKLDNKQKLNGFEVLLRWKHPLKGMIPPDKFIPVAEEIGYIIRLGEWVLHKACETLSKWQALFPELDIQLAVNISPLQFSHASFLDNIKKLVCTTETDVSKLILEITEQALFGDIVQTQNIMESIRSLGFSFSLDDFGTGYSSLYHLKNLPISEIKIDRSFIRDILIDKNDAVIVEAIASISEKLSLKLVAEGVETDDQFAYLEQIGCDLYQGYLFSKPMTEEDTLNYIAAVTSDSRSLID